MNIRKYALFAIVAAFLLAGTVADTAQASHSWGGYHWARTTNPFALKLGDNLTTAWDSYLSVASTDWSVSAVLDTIIVPGVSNPKNCRATSGRIEVCNSKYGNNGWLGIAQIWANGTHITQGTVKLNDTYFVTAKYNTPAWKQFVVCQEVGHAFGLDHQDEAFDNTNLGTCMDYTSDPARNDGVGNNLHPNAHDYDQLLTIYSHMDSLTTISSKLSGSAPATPDLSNPSEWGKTVANEQGGRAVRFERDLGHGQKVFTFVVWAD